MIEAQGATAKAAGAEPAVASPPYPSPVIAWYSVGVLLVFYIFSFVDRQIISLLVEPMKRDLQISDTQVGLLSGFAFAALYAVAGIPIGFLADRFNRKSVIAVGVVVWSVMETLCGMARTAWQLFFARVGVGVGEAALSPAAYSMITDTFPREKLGRAFSIYNMGISIGSGIALLLGGIVAVAVSKAGASYTLPIIGEVRAWQLAFIVTGAPGVLLPLLLLSIREPVRRGLIKVAGATDAAPQAQRVPLGEVVKYMFRNGHFYSLHFMAMAMMSTLGYGVGQWLPTAMSRTYSIPPGEIGKILGVSTLLINTIGIFVAGRICDLLTRRGHKDAPILVCIGTAVAVVVTSSLPEYMPTPTLGLIMMCAAGFPFHGYVAMGPMAVNQVTPNQMRAQMSSVYLMAQSMIGMTVGPALVPLISDHIIHNPKEIRLALVLVVVIAGTISAILSWFARPVYRKRMADAAQWH